ncbi:hypothetical protein G3D28_004600, partial [Salmonella enterica subsp. enterica]|nr:hypothetical protein [Salmonella enterica]ECA7961356.1 hypothetical protein [Salmonella enterica subsp. enterica serovar Indiana]ECZ9625113.1 hypothetical protein [Salmonella enterica subsp. enterica serovar Kiambu]MJB50399.1 hypothetical protein [Salmonella enterica subsp. enterica serovar Livingstone]EAX4780906.1 hypothetical protein [Salmonella enterica]
MFFLVFKTTCHCPQEGWFIIAFFHYNNSLWIIYISFFNIKHITTRKLKHFILKVFLIFEYY